MNLEPVIGLEIHTELATKSKIFCRCTAQFGASPNTQTCPVCLGMPGSLPVLNHDSLELALKTALAVGCTIPDTMQFDRKNYYYPDLPKNYQISQLYQQLGINGNVDLRMPDGSTKRIGISDIHLEEDAGKLIHPETPELRGESWVDLNRAGTTLLEIVSGPDMGSMEEMEVYMRTMRSLLQYLEVSDCKMEEGSLRFEVNISVREKGTTKLNNRVEIKNLNSIKIAMKSAAYEFDRQCDLVENGEPVAQETRLWDEDREMTLTMRTKEDAHDYRYFPDPDLVPIQLDRSYLEELAKTLPELQEAKRARFMADFKLPEYDASLLVADQGVAHYFEACNDIHPAPKIYSNWISTEILRELNKEEDADIRDFAIQPDRLAQMVQLIEKGTISGKIAKTVFAEMMESDDSPEAIVEKKGLVQVSDEGELLNVVAEVIEANPEPVAEYRDGKQKALGFLMGQIMKITKGKANPKLVNELLRKKLSEE